MNQFWNGLSPQVQVEIIKLLKTAMLVFAGGLLLLIVRFKVHNEHVKPNEKHVTAIEFEGGFKKK